MKPLTELYREAEGHRMANGTIVSVFIPKEVNVAVLGLIDAAEEHHSRWSENGLCMSECGAICRALQRLRAACEKGG